MSPSDVQRLARLHQQLQSGEARAIRVRAGVGRVVIAGSVGPVSESAVARWERGERIPRPDVGLRYARLLDRLQRQLDAGQPASA